MPLGDYRCECGYEKYDKLVKATNEDQFCPECGDKMVKQTSKANSAFRGRGFHAVDYRSPTRGY